jgi:hypothetical protein
VPFGSFDSGLIAVMIGPVLQALRFMQGLRNLLSLSWFFSEKEYWAVTG